MPTQVFVNCSAIPIAVFTPAKKSLGDALQLTPYSGHHQAEYNYSRGLLGVWDERKINSQNCTDMASGYELDGLEFISSLYTLSFKCLVIS